jgi:thioredoxin 1
VTVEVYEQTSLTQQNRISIIPTQVVYDASGKEFYRHIGLWPREEILGTLKKMALIQG